MSRGWLTSRATGAPAVVHDSSYCRVLGYPRRRKWPLPRASLAISRTILAVLARSAPVGSAEELRRVAARFRLPACDLESPRYSSESRLLTSV